MTDSKNEIKNISKPKRAYQKSSEKNRRWIKNYNKMMDRYELLKAIPNISNDFLKGYEECVKNFTNTKSEKE